MSYLSNTHVAWDEASSQPIRNHQGNLGNNRKREEEVKCCKPARNSIENGNSVLVRCLVQAEYGSAAHVDLFHSQRIHLDKRQWN
jgi:hypothetical protein